MIEEISQAWDSVPDSLRWVLLAVSAIVLLFQVVALVDLARRDRVLWDRKWIWVLIILLVSNGIGALLYFILGRKVPEQVDGPVARQASASNEERTQSAVDTLYGGDDG